MGNRKPNGGDSLLTIRALTAGYGASEVLHQVNLDVRQGEIVTMVGANGAGKTTTLRSIYGLTNIREGRIHFKGEDITGWSSHRLAGRGLAFAPQERSIFPSLSVYENLEMGGYSLSSEDELAANMERVFTRFPRLEERRHQKAGTLSGGERRMLAIGRGLMSSPDLLMLDEPSLGLAPMLVADLFEQVERVNEDGTAIFLVEQNARRALSIADRAYVLELGRIRHEGSGQELLDDPEVQRAYLGG
jgi:ABC-type branched-subunit amino acid transport system ATPase component